MARAARWTARLAIADVIYRVIVREPLREHLGMIEKRPHGRITIHALGAHGSTLYPDLSLVTRSRLRAALRERRLSKDGFEHKTLAVPPRASRA